MRGISESLTGTADPPVTAWHRRLGPGRTATPWPPPAPDGAGPHRTAFLRLPRAKDELEMSVHAAAHRLAPGGRLYVHGAKDEGAGSAAARIEPLFGEVRTVATGGRCRLLEAVRPGDPPGLRAPLEAWRVETPPPHPELAARRRWVSYPGVFAAGRLDDGTALLLDALGSLPPLRPADRVLDFGTGDGVVAAVLTARAPGLRPTGVDNDMVALEAARENVPEAELLLADGLSDLSAETPPYDLIVANPPYHRGKSETLGVVEGLIRGAPSRLVPGGRLVLVVQRRLPVEPLLRDAFGGATVLADRAAFRVWEARR